MAAISTVNCTKVERAATRSVTATGVSDGSGRFSPNGRPADSDCLGNARNARRQDSCHSGGRFHEFHELQSGE